MNRRKRTGGAAVIWVNLLLVCGIAAVFVFYNSSYRSKLREQNLADITNINRALAGVSSSYLFSQQQRLSDAVQYISQQSFSREEAMEYICAASSSAAGSFELVRPDSTGLASARDGDGYAAVDYTSADYSALKKVFAAVGKPADGILCTPEFTDSYTALKSFALYAYLTLPGDDGAAEQDTLMAVFRSSDFAAKIDVDGGYEGLSSVLVDRDGSYVFGSPDFKSDNLFSYFYVFNGLTLYEKRQAAAAFSAADSCTFYYRDSRGQDCVFVCCAVPDTAWRCVSCVPLTSFHDTEMDFRFTLWVTGLLAALMGFNLFWMNRANRRLRVSVRREQEAGEAKTDFLSRMSHDIRTPLNVIIGTTLLAQRAANPPETQKYLRDIDQSGKFLLSLVNDILDLNKVESGKMELHPAPYALCQLRDSMQAIIAPLCREKDLTLTIRGCDSAQAYLLDSVRLNQIFFNLLSNSVKFTPPGGHVSLECAVSDAAGGVQLTFRAADDGIGMSEAFQQHMFEAFTQEGNAAPAAQGTGLGLAIVKNLVGLMGGTVRVRSSEGKGTIFSVTIPTKKVSAAAAAPAKEISAEVLRGRCVLLVEDNATNAEIAQVLLQDKGMRVEYAANGREAVERFSASAPGHFSLILMDLRMPVMNGIDATHAIRALPRPDAAAVPIVAMTANAYDVDVQNCLAAGMNAHLAKPIDPPAMYAVLAQVVDAASVRQGSGPAAEEPPKQEP